MVKLLSSEDIARRVARDIPDGAYVNLGIGVPMLVADHPVAGREFVLHSENGLLGMRRDRQLRGGDEREDDERAERRGQA